MATPLTPVSTPWGSPMSDGSSHPLPYRAKVAMEPCLVAPSPELQERIDAELARLRGRQTRSNIGSFLAIARKPRTIGFDDGVIIPPDEFPLGTPEAVIRAAAAD